jgi:SRSO17 transposase
MGVEQGLGGAVERWLTPFLEVVGRKTRRTWTPLYVQGLLGPEGRRSVQPMAARLGLSSHDQLHHFLTSPAWDDAPLWRVLARTADRLVGGPGAVLVIDDTALPKKGELSVGVARQYCGALGKRANCQVLVSATLAGGEVPVPVGLRLFLPAAWVDDPDRCARAGVPESGCQQHSKPEIALAEIDRLRAAGLRFSTVLADAGFGMSAAFRHGLDMRQLLWAVGIPRTQTLYRPGVRLRWPRARTGRPRTRPVPSAAPRSAEAMLARARWRRISWRRGTKGPLASPPYGSGLLTGRTPAQEGICLGRSCGWSANGAAMASANTTSPICRPGHHCGGLRRRSRRAGSVSRHTSNSNKRSASATSKGAPGPGCTGTR